MMEAGTGVPSPWPPSPGAPKARLVGKALPDLPEGEQPCRAGGSASHLLLSGAEAGGPDRGVGHPSPPALVLREGPQGQAGA